MWLPTIKHKKYINAPTLIIWATGDKALHKDLAVLSSKYVKNSCSIRYIEGKGHQVHQVYPQEVNRYMREFLTQDMPTPGGSQSKLWILYMLFEKYQNFKIKKLL